MKSDTIGIVGGGQLARMLAMAAARLNFRIIILEPNPSCPAAQVANKHLVANYDDLDALDEFSRLCKIVTYEFENIPIQATHYLTTRLPVYPSPEALKISQDRLFEKCFFRNCGINTAHFYEINSQSDIEKKLADFTGKGIFKTRRMGYDGKGQYLYHSDESLEKIYSSLGNNPLIFEEFVPFKCEISIIAARSVNNLITYYDPIENTHDQGILKTSKVPANINSTTITAAYKAVEKILIALNYIGVLCVEFFITDDERLIANEMAPRVHNSGHWTEAACVVSQFEQHIRSISNLPLGKTSRHSDCIMHNIIGNEINTATEWLKHDSAFIHLYGKSEALPRRKMGHITQIFSLPKKF
ncbi:Phosphoribosylaminoimidazole carboxylase ATPase subunit [Liberibacter crescens BT-1]|uniref:N5-carboxyaminoimidazole ribonucleotide synthase n=1 Tax=Liberibacter crescens (strain BT-1) TaxID=1215343 RepID=L0EWU7_LIBCB|nr:5-(carboxyamino)imidazole ribonucleotide synthase [Liberibacter crescens]AGA64856.1 Phosphoribosylaminoimidazole carboxylase ATPase subunit [Liberibacter crescens BT-1]AMC12902.1 phosphoribosylaminoimidazole carboxylase [Liberibacter crescens]